MGGGSNQLGSLLLVGALILLVIAFTRGRRQQRDAATVQQRLAPGTEVMTTSGLFATVVAVDGASVTLETGPGQQSRWDKRAVARIVSPPAGADPADAPVQDEAPAAENTVGDAGQGGTGGVDLGKAPRQTDDEEPPPGRE